MDGYFCVSTLQMEMRLNIHVYLLCFVQSSKLCVHVWDREVCSDIARSHQPNGIFSFGIANERGQTVDVIAIATFRCPMMDYKERFLDQAQKIILRFFVLTFTSSIMIAYHWILQPCRHFLWKNDDKKRIKFDQENSRCRKILSKFWHQPDILCILLETKYVGKFDIWTCYSALAVPPQLTI